MTWYLTGMRKVLSTRLEEAALDELERGARQLGMTKRQFLEEAIHLRAGQAEDWRKAVREALEASFGIMQRDEPVEETVRQAREATEAMFTSHLHLFEEPE